MKNDYLEQCRKDWDEFYGSGAWMHYMEISGTIDELLKCALAYIPEGNLQPFEKLDYTEIREGFIDPLIIRDLKHFGSLELAAFDESEGATQKIAPDLYEEQETEAFAA